MHMALTTLPCATALASEHLHRDDRPLLQQTEIFDDTAASLQIHVGRRCPIELSSPPLQTIGGSSTTRRCMTVSVNLLTRRRKQRCRY
jgi:hypothetical protein